MDQFSRPLYAHVARMEAYTLDTWYQEHGRGYADLELAMTDLVSEVQTTVRRFKQGRIQVQIQVLTKDNTKVLVSLYELARTGNKLYEITSTSET